MVWIVVGFALLASAFTANKLLLYDLSPVFLVALRMTIPGLLLVGLYLKKRSVNLKWSHLIQDAKSLFIICVCTTFVPALLKAYALKHLVSSEAVLIGSLDPFITAIYAYFLFSERLTWPKFFGILTGFLSIFVLISSKNPLDEGFYFKLVSLPILSAIGAVVIGRYGWILTQKLLQANRYEPAEINGITMLVSGLCALIASIVTKEVAPLSIFLDYRTIGLLAYTVVVGNLIAYNMYAYFLKMHKVTLISFLGFIVPIFSHLYGRLFLSEPLSLKFVIAVILACIGLRIYSVKKVTEETSKEM